MKLKLSINERLGILSTLPSRGGKRQNQKDYVAIKKVITPTENELKRYGLFQTKEGWSHRNNADINEKIELNFENNCLKSLFDLLIVLEENDSFPEWGVDIIDDLELKYAK